MLATGALHAANLDPVLEHGLAASSALERLVVLVDGTTTSVTRANERFCQVAGRTLDEVTSSTLGQLLAPGEGARIRTVDEAVAAALGGAPVRVPLQVQVQGRGGAALVGTLSRLPAADGEPDRVLLVADQAGDEAALVEARGLVTAVDRSQAIIEFGVDGTILRANRNFLEAVGYTANEVTGRHHRMFCEADLVASPAYADFWERLGRGEFAAGEYKRLAKGGREVWLQATYNPVLSGDGTVVKIVKFASDITEVKRRSTEHLGKVNAVDRSQAVIEFGTDGVIVTANRNFLDAMGYTLPEIAGKHHRMFCDPEQAASEAYAQFWERLSGGEFESGEYKRLAKGGREVWLQATYNPILDADGTVVRIVKFASDITDAKQLSAEHVGKVNAVDRSQAVVELGLDGKVVTANRNFLDVMGYSLQEVAGKHHRMFCELDYVNTSQYADFWDRLGAGEFESGEYKRLAKGGREVWLQATYNPIMDADGRVVKIVKFASDISDAKRRNAEYVGKVNAVERAQAVIEFDLEGKIVHANKNFLDVVGYNLAEVVGKHHRMFCEPTYTATEEYAEFWQRLGAGEYDSGEFKRLGKGGKEVWLQATYNPILDVDGRPMKVVKFATDITQARIARAEITGKLDAVQRAQATIEFDLDGVVVDANDNFLRVMGYSLREIVGQHHSTFCSEDYVRGEEYRDFWLRLGKGEFIAGRFPRVGKFGREVHIHAAYNPILDLNGNVIKIVKYAYDVTAEVQREQRIAASTADITVSVQNLSGSIEDIAQSSAVATGLADETQSNAAQGVEALRASLEAIALIQKSSSSIGEIVRVMGEIANQTNLLAFNASIEAARAGEHGVGFSIVAGEVRKLAERSSEAAQQIARLIDESAERVTQGSEVSKRAEEAFERIVTSVGKTSDAIRAISDSTRTQQQASQTVDALLIQIATHDAGT